MPYISALISCLYGIGNQWASLGKAHIIMGRNMLIICGNLDIGIHYWCQKEAKGARAATCYADMTEASFQSWRLTGALAMPVQKTQGMSEAGHG